MLFGRQRKINPKQEFGLSWRVCNSMMAATALLAFCSVGLMAQGPDPWGDQGNQDRGWGSHDRPTRTFPDTTNGIFAFTDQISMASLTPAQIQFAATHYVGGQKQTTAQAALLRAYNRNFLIMHYRLGEELGYGACDANDNPTATNPLTIVDNTWVVEWPGDSVVKPDWFYQYGGYPRIYDCGDQHFLMNLDDPGWRWFWSKQVIKQLKDNDDDAVFADSYSIPNYFGNVWDVSLPVVDASFEGDWAKSMFKFNDFIRDRFAGRWKWIPNAGAWVTSRDPNIEYSNVDGVMIEGFADYGNANFLAPSDWILQMDNALSITSRDKILIAQTYASAFGGYSYERQEVLASYLLIKGNHTYLNIAASGGSDPGGSTLQWWPDYMIDLGRPIEPLPRNNDITKLWNAKWNVFERRFEKGIVMVNSTANDTGVITLPHTYYQVIGDGNSGGAVVPADPSTTGWPTRNALAYQAVTTIDLAGCNADPNMTPCAAVLLDKLPATTPQ